MGNEINPVGLTVQQSKALEAEAASRAAADPLPGSLATAFLSSDIKVGDYSVRRLVASDWKILKGLDSPIFKQLLEMQKAKELQHEVSFSDEEQWEMVWQFTHTPRECRELFAKGRDVFRATAEEWADTALLPDLPLLIDAIMKQILASFEPTIKYTTEKKMT